MIIACGFYAPPVGNMAGHPIYTDKWHMLFINKSGSLIDDIEYSESNTASEDAQDGLRDQSRITLGLTLSFMSCKNVSVAKEDRAARGPAPKRWRGIRYHTLEIGPMASKVAAHAKANGTGYAKSLHICRGHMRTYTEDAPLFGRFTGTFYVPMHTRGSREVGEVIKDYRTKAG
jgi:hypothetical protein